MKTGDYYHLASARIIATANKAAMPLRASFIFNDKEAWRTLRRIDKNI
jgi:hypothetical protein